MTSIEERKRRHLEVSLNDDTQSLVGTGFADVSLIHRCLPEMNSADIDIRVELFGHHLSAPFIISAITGGTEEAARVNRNLAKAAQELGIGMGVGSQRIALEDPSKEYTFRIARETAPSALIIANLGCPQLTLGYGVREAKKCIEMIDANVLAVHMNPLQESIQMGGETRYRGVLEKIGTLTKELSLPVIMKETGSGVASEEAVRLERAGVKGIDVSGVGGTSWSAVEQHIAKEQGDTTQENLGEAFRNWGIPTAISVVEVRKSTNLVVVASGGIRTGIDITKAIALGANSVSIAQPLLKYAVQSSDSVIDYIRRVLLEFQTTMFLVGAKTLDELKHVPLVITGRTEEWLRLRGFKPEDFTHRLGV